MLNYFHRISKKSVNSLIKEVSSLAQTIQVDSVFNGGLKSYTNFQYN